MIKGGGLLIKVKLLKILNNFITIKLKGGGLIKVKQINTLHFHALHFNKVWLNFN